MKGFELLKYWKEQLRMTDYNIKLKINCSPKDMDIEGSQGCVEYINVHKSGLIKILSEDLYPKDCILNYNFEVILVHELLHIKFGVIESNITGLAYDLLHQQIEDLARALVFSKNNKSVREYQNGY